MRYSPQNGHCARGDASESAEEAQILELFAGPHDMSLRPPFALAVPPRYLLAWGYEICAASGVDRRVCVDRSCTRA